jgi:sn-glycerol 3-phosphate transport system permease protein
MLYETPPVPGLPAHYVGLHQIVPTLTSTQFTQSLVTTLIFVVLVVPLSLILGLALAVAAHRKLKGIAIYRMIFSSTVVSSVAVASVVFGTLMNPVVGLLPWLGINPTPPAAGEHHLGPPRRGRHHHLAVPRPVLHHHVGRPAVGPRRALGGGADRRRRAWTRFWRMTVPLLSPTIFFALVVSTIYAFQSFGAVDILIGYQNAANLHANVLIYEIVNTLQMENNPGAAAIMATVLFLITLGLTLLQMRFLERRVHYANCANCRGAAPFATDAPAPAATPP